VNSQLEYFKSQLKFGLDDFQLEACKYLEDGFGVLVAAPTGAGKTLVGEFAIHLAISRKQKVFYTTPIKALSNQKYQELGDRYGFDRVGLLTGDVNNNGDAEIVVMTTEILRNMIYENSESLINLGFVVLDEVHYLADRFRGPVWEEVILHLPKSTKLVSLSATVSNAEEFGGWLSEVRGPTKIVVSQNRPVPLNQHVLFGDKMLDLFEDSRKSTVVSRELVAKHLEKQRQPAIRSKSQSKFRGSSRNEPKIPKLGKSEVIAELRDNDLLPAIFFIFSRAACDAAVTAVREASLRLTSREEREQIRSIVHQETNELSEEDRQTLGYETWLRGLENGVAAHHAGLLPTFKQVVEKLFLQRLVKVVFATETLALGINMPARTVVLDRLDKFNGEGRVQITPGEYTQLTGRAGRRGIDTQGHSVIQWAGNLSPENVAALASKRSYPLISAFKPTYNMAVNLVNAFGRARAREVLETSFAQFQADRSVVHLAKGIRDKEISLSGYRESISCHLGDFNEYAAIRREITDLERDFSASRKGSREQYEERKIPTKHELDKRVSRLRQQLKEHPCHRCDERENHARWAERWWRLRRETDATIAQIESRTNVIAKNFDRLCDQLLDLEYLKLVNGELELTTHGEMLSQIYGDRDLVISEIVRRNVWTEVDAATLASLISTITFESRRDDDTISLRMPRGRFEDHFMAQVEIVRQIDRSSKRHQVRRPEQLDPSIAYGIHRWATGSKLDDVLFEIDMPVGDFIRVIKQIVDVLEQLTRLGDTRLAATAQHSIESVKRGIVAYAYYA